MQNFITISSYKHKNVHIPDHLNKWKIVFTYFLCNTSRYFFCFFLLLKDFLITNRNEIL